MRLYSIGLSVVAATAILVQASQARAVELALSGVMDDGSRWFEIFSDAYAEVGQIFEKNGAPLLDCPSLTGPQGRPCDFPFLASQLPDTVPIGISGGDVVFSRGNLLDLGTITYDDSALTGVGVESAPVTGYTANFSEDIADDDNIGNTSYTTTIPASGITGGVRLIDGVVVDLSFSAEVDFTYDPGGNLGGPFVESGEIVFENQRFFLLVGDVPGKTFFSSNFTTLDWGWDIAGTVDQVFVEGDHDGDGDVDVADVLVLQRTFGEEGPLLAADNNADQIVDGSDLALWESALGTGSSLSITQVPEPTNLWSGVVGASFVLVVLRR